MPDVAEAVHAGDAIAKLGPPPPCPLCGGKAVKVLPYLNPTDEFVEIFSGRGIAVCGDCGFGNSYPSIAGSDLAKYYGASFTPRFQERVKKGDWPFFDERSMAQVSLARMFADFKPGDGYLDVGPGVGISYFTATQLLDKPKLFGVEMNKEMIATLKRNLPGITITDTVPKIKAAAKGVPITICLMSHCIEHFNGDEVLQAVKEIYDVMAPGGIFVCEVPHWDLRRWTSRKNDVPHLGFFSAQGLATAIRSGGFELIFQRTYGLPHGSSRNTEVDRRKAFDANTVKGPGLFTLILANSPDNLPRADGKLLRAVGRKPLA